MQKKPKKKSREFAQTLAALNQRQLDIMYGLVIDTSHRHIRWTRRVWVIVKPSAGVRIIG